jgi:NADH:ubiquinone oxidoreductase subunit C
VETAETLVNKIHAIVPGSVTESFGFGRSERMALWLESRSVAAVAQVLAIEPGVELDWLENLSVFQREGTLVVTYFLRSTTTDRQLVLRTSVKLVSDSREAELPSVSAIWQMAAPFEIDAAELMGIHFVDKSGKAAHRPHQRLPLGWKGYPLRKSYVFPKTFLGIDHARMTRKPTGRDGERE